MLKLSEINRHITYVFHDIQRSMTTLRDPFVGEAPKDGEKIEKFLQPLGLEEYKDKFTSWEHLMESNRHVQRHTIGLKDHKQRRRFRDAVREEKARMQLCEDTLYMPQKQKRQARYIYRNECVSDRFQEEESEDEMQFYIPTDDFNINGAWISPFKGTKRENNQNKKIEDNRINFIQNNITHSADIHLIPESYDIIDLDTANICNELYERKLDKEHVYTNNELEEYDKNTNTIKIGTNDADIDDDDDDEESSLEPVNIQTLNGPNIKPLRLSSFLNEDEISTLSKHCDPQVALAHKIISQGQEQYPDDKPFIRERPYKYIPGSGVVDPYDYQIEKAFVTPIADYQFERSMYIDRVTHDKVTQATQRISSLIDQVDSMHKSAVRSGTIDLPNRNALKRFQSDEYDDTGYFISDINVDKNVNHNNRDEK